MKTPTPVTQLVLHRKEYLFNIDFASYQLSHHQFARHFHDHYVIELVTKGADSFYCNGQNHVATEDQLVLINPGEVHTGSTINNTPLHYYSFYPTKKMLQQIADTLDIQLPSTFEFSETIRNNPALARTIEKLFIAMENEDSSMLQQELFFECMQQLLANVTNVTSVTNVINGYRDKRINLLIDFLSTHFREDVSLQQMSELVRLNPFHLIRVFKKAKGISPYEYLLVVRTEYARHLLRKGYKVGEASLEAGFYDSSHFNRLFRKIAGTSPKTFLS